jgi:hypothetical protein
MPSQHPTDEELFRLAARLTRRRGRRALVRLALEALIERESARYLARMGGSHKGLRRPLRRRPGSAA